MSQQSNATLAIATAAAALATLANSLSLSRVSFLIVAIVIAGVVSICMQLMLPSIAMNMEHVYKYNRAIGELEKRACTDLCEVQKQFLPNIVYEGALSGTETARHNKRVTRSISWLVRLLAAGALFISGLYFVTTRHPGWIGGVSIAVLR